MCRKCESFVGICAVSKEGENEGALNFKHTKKLETYLLVFLICG
jgi:hypothetical protein